MDLPSELPEVISFRVKDGDPWYSNQTSKNKHIKNSQLIELMDSITQIKWRVLYSQKINYRKYYFQKTFTLSNFQQSVNQGYNI